MKGKAIYEAEKAELRKSQGPKHRRPTPIQKEYRACLRTVARSTAAPSRSLLFTEAAAEWQKMKAKQAEWQKMKAKQVQEKYEL